jgi:hypothetical protein
MTEIGSRRYAVKELFDGEAPAAALIAAEVEFTALAADAVRGMLAAYRATGAPARITDDAFGFVIASRLNFLRRQVGIALDAAVQERHRDWAVREIDEALRILPTPTVFAQLIDVDAARRTLPRRFPPRRPVR